MSDLNTDTVYMGELWELLNSHGYPDTEHPDYWYLCGYYYGKRNMGGWRDIWDIYGPGYRRLFENGYNDGAGDLENAS